MLREKILSANIIRVKIACLTNRSACIVGAGFKGARLP
jgi:hypothetical protein